MPNPSGCVVCGKSSDIVVWIENGYEGRQCSCGTVYTFPTPAPDAVDVTHDGHPACFYSAYANLKAKWVTKVKPPGRLLEIGCGDGFFLRQAKALGYDVAGVDASTERAANVARALGVEVRGGLFEELEFTQKYDVVYHCDLLSHFPEPVIALKKMCSILKPGGVLVFEVGTLAQIHPVWYRWIGMLGYPHHRWLYSERSLQAVFDQAGLSVVRTRHFGLAPSVLFTGSVVLLARLARSTVRPAGVPESARRLISTASFSDRVEQFLRYRAGAIAPRIGPGTLFVAACPQDVSQEVSA
jgi:SAM-dependent methyltransferase